MSEIDLRWRLRQLEREREPAHDLWPGIAARLERPVGGSLARRQSRWQGWALAASLLLVAGLAWQWRPITAAAPDPATNFAILEAAAMTREYSAAMQQLSGVPVPEPLRPSLETLDRSALQIRAAIAADPQSAFLLQRLQHTYSQRLALTQRAITG